MTFTCENCELECGRRYNGLCGNCVGNPKRWSEEYKSGSKRGKFG